MGRVQKRGRKRTSSPSLVREAARMQTIKRRNILLKVYIGTWAQYYPHPFRARDEFDLITSEKRVMGNFGRLDSSYWSANLHNMVEYWCTIASMDNETDDFQKWLYSLSWPRCWCSVDRTSGTLRKLKKHSPHFRGSVLVQFEFKDRDFADLPDTVGSVSLRGHYNFSNSAFRHLSALKKLKSLRLHEYSGSAFIDSAIQHLSNLTSLAMCQRSETIITDSAFKHLGDLKSLTMSGDPSEFALQHLPQLTSLHIYRWMTYTIIDSTFERFSNLKSLALSSCCGYGLTNSAFQHLSNLQFLSLDDFGQRSINGHAFEYLSNLRSLKISGSIGGVLWFPNLSHLTSLDMCGCGSDFFDDTYENLTNLKSLKMSGFSLALITGSAFQKFSNLTSLNMSNCSECGFRKSALKYLWRLKLLNIHGFRGFKIDDSVFKHLPNLTSLDIAECKQDITDSAFKYVSNLRSLAMDESLITDSALRHLSKLTSLSTVDRSRQPLRILLPDVVSTRPINAFRAIMLAAVPVILLAFAFIMLLIKMVVSNCFGKRYL